MLYNVQKDFICTKQIKSGKFSFNAKNQLITYIYYTFMQTFMQNLSIKHVLCV